MPVIVVVIVKKTILPKEVGCISFHDTKKKGTGKCYLFALSYVFVELGKFYKTIEELETIEDFWLYYMSTTEGTVSRPPHIIDK
jgi:hypothetical protein